MPWVTGAIVGGAMLGGSYLSSKANQNAADTNAAAQVEAARIAAEASKFRPVGMTTNFGQSNFTLDENGNLTSAGYTLDPRLQNLQTGLMGNYANYLNQAQNVDTSQLQQGARGLMSLGNQYLATSPQEAAAQYMREQNALLAPTNEQNLAGIRNKLFQKGRSGLATGGTVAGGMQATNPEMAAYYNSLANQQNQLAAQATQAGMARTQFGQGLLSGGAGLQGTGYQLQSSAYGPLSTTLGISGAVEEQGLQPLTLGANLGGRTTQANQYGAGLMNTAAQNAAALQYAANRTSPLGSALTGLGSNQQLTSGLGNNISNWFSNVLNTNSTASPFFNTGADVFSPSYMGGTSFGE
jgi:hypothetical protein